MREELPERYFYNRNKVVRIGQLLRSIFPKRNTSDKTYQQVQDAWRSVVTDAVYRGTEIIGYKNNVLYVCVESSAMIHHLTNFEKNAIISGINVIMGMKCIDDIRFKTGQFK